VYIAATWTASPDPKIAGYNVTFNRDSGQSISTYRVDSGSAYHEPAVAGSSYVVTVSNVYINGVLGTQILQDTIIAATDTTVPSTPTGLSLGTGIRSITISWDENTEPDMEFGLGQYRVQLSNDGTFSGGDIIRDKVVGALVTTFADLATNVQYWARVAAVDTSGNESTFSASVNGTTGEVQGTDIADLAITNAKIANATIESAKIVELNADKIVAGSGFVNVLTVNSGGSIESANYDNVGPIYDGWKIDNNSAVFNNVTVRGTLDSVVGTFGVITGGQLEINWTGSPTPTSGLRVRSTGDLDIGGLDASSWHVDDAGNMWWGSSTTYAGATNKISNTGSIDFTTGNFSGTLSSGISINSPVITGGQIDIGGTWHVDSSGNMWWGGAANYAAASIKISSSGFVDFTSGNFSGTLSSGISISSPVISGGSISGTTITGSTLQTATSGKRVVIDASGTYSHEVAFYASGSTPLATMDAQITSFVIDTTGTLLLRGGATGTGANAGIQIWPDGGGELLMNLTTGSDLHVQSGAQTLLYVDESTERVGIRVNNPQSSLAILANGTDQSLRCSTGAEINTIGATGAHGDFIVNCLGTNFTVDAGGGGVTAPATTVSGAFYNFNSWNVPVSGLAAPKDVWVEDQTGFFGFSASSIRYKTMVEDLDPEYGRKIYDFRPVWYRRYPEPYDVQDENGVSPWSEYGLIAEEVHEIEPRLVAYDSDGSCNCKTQTVENYGGSGVTRDIVRHHPSCMNVPSTVHYKSFVPHLIWAVKDHVKRIEELEAQVAALQGAV
jgi:hypothetical protein